MTKQTKFHDMISNVTAIIEDSNTCIPFINYKILGTKFYPLHPLKAQANTYIIINSSKISHLPVNHFAFSTTKIFPEMSKYIRTYQLQKERPQHSITRRKI